MANVSRASSSTEGFFQLIPTLEAQYKSPDRLSDFATPGAAQRLSDDPVLAQGGRLLKPSVERKAPFRSLMTKRRPVLTEESPTLALSTYGHPRRQ
ncbi:hypothetical protein F4818DRAFT_65304 [Hypoxylon cercidicola]|nr:hypothetical protein F4818DRAFT_65304 [Hypoxylon cercidicola]